MEKDKLALNNVKAEFATLQISLKESQDAFATLKKEKLFLENMLTQSLGKDRVQGLITIETNIQNVLNNMHHYYNNTKVPK